MKTTTYQPGKNIDDIRKKYNIKRVIKLASNENPSGPSIKAINAGVKIQKKINRYPDSHSVKLKHAINSFLSKPFIKLNNIIIGNGSNEILEFVARRFLNEKSEVLFCKHSFLVYKIISKNMNAKIIESKPVNEPGSNYLSIDLQDMSKRITSKTKVIFIANPSNPTGTILKVKEIDGFIKRISKKIIVVIDEAYYEYALFRGFKSAINLLKKYPNVVITRSFSKIHALAGLRIGYGIASDSIAKDFNNYRQPFNINYIAQEMATASLSDKSFVNKSLKENHEGMIYLKSCFDDLGIPYLDSYTNFLTINLGKYTKRIYNALLCQGIILRPLDNYELPNYLRITIGTEKENKLLISKLKKILKSVK